MNVAPVAIVGAGLAGLAAARLCAERGVPFRVYEAGPRVAGLAASHRDADGFLSDFGAHFVTNRLAAETGVSHLAKPANGYGESVILGRRIYGYPLGLMRSPRFALSAAKSKVGGLMGGPPENARDWFRACYGRELADRVALPLVEAWSGRPAGELAASVGQKIPSGLAKTIYLHAAAKLLGKPVAVGYCATLPESRKVWHVSIAGGVGALCESLAEPIRDHVQTRSPVEAICLKDGRAAGLRVGGEFIPARAVVSTAPAPILAKLLAASGELSHLAAFKFRAMAFVEMRFSGRNILPDVVCWTPDKGLPYFRLTEVTRAQPDSAPEGRAVITADVGCQVGDGVWTADDDALTRECLAALSRRDGSLPGRFVGSRVLRVATAYPVFLLEYEAARAKLAEGTDIPGLASVGRNGEFGHWLMEDVYHRTRRKVGRVLDEIEVPSRAAT